MRNWAKPVLDWLRKPRLSDENWRKQIEFLGKGFAITVAAVWLLMIGTEYFDRQEKVLGASGMPIADTAWSPAGVTYYGAGDGSCEVNGQYQITNNGDLAFRIDTVTIRLFHLREPLASQLGKKQFPNAQVFSSRSRVHQLSPFAADVMPTKETLAKGNRLDASFRIRFRIPEDLNPEDQFIVVATGAGGLRKPDTISNRLFGWLWLVDAELTDFKEDDLYISTQTFSIDPGVCVGETRPGVYRNGGTGRLEMKIG